VDVKLGLLKLKGEHRLRVFDNRVLRRISDLRRDDKQESGEDTTRVFMICTLTKRYSADK
jgi:uncharacterized protein (UPF0335 family)